MSDLPASDRQKWWAVLYVATRTVEGVEVGSGFEFVKAASENEAIQAVRAIVSGSILPGSSVTWTLRTVPNKVAISNAGYDFFQSGEGHLFLDLPRIISSDPLFVEGLAKLFDEHNYPQQSVGVRRHLERKT